VPAERASVSPPAAAIEVGSLNLQPSYPHGAATRAAAKTSVTSLRRSTQPDEEAIPLPVRVKRDKGGAERGLAVHTFLERFSLSTATFELALRTEAHRLVRDGFLTPDQVAHIDFDAISAFWRSSIGTELLRHPGEIRRELPFTFKATRADLLGAGLANNLALPDDEFVLIQGVADLVWISDSQIWLIDFKTDRIGSGDLKSATERYRPQLLLYALALSKIYGRSVTKKGIFFLEARKFAWF
jgi:ATP-dependent helicase/nuclease subunit A